MKKTKISILLSTFILLVLSPIGCGKQTTSTDNITTAESIVSPSQAETIDIISDAPTAESQENTDNGLIIPDYDYDEYLTASLDDTTPTLGYNIPLGWQKNADSFPKFVTLSQDGNREQAIELAYNNSVPLLKNLEAGNIGNHTVTELSPVETPLGTFRIFNLTSPEENVSNMQYALLPVTEEDAVFIAIYYSYGNPHFYQDSMKLLLADLFDKKQSPIEIPTDREYYLQTDSGENILGMNLIEGFLYDSSTSHEDNTYIGFYAPEYQNHYCTITAYVYNGIASVYSGTTDKVELKSRGEVLFTNYYAEKGTCETIYGTAKLYNESSEDNSFENEVAVLRLNGKYIMIHYQERDANYDTVESDNISSILAQLLN